MTEGSQPQALDERLRHDINNAMMVVLSFAQIIDRHAGANPVVHDAVVKITEAVDRSRVTVAGVSEELGEIAARLARR